MGLPDNILVKERMQKEGMANENTRFVITHFAHTFNPLHEHTDSLARTNGFIAAFDGMVLDI
jgi:phosphoribosyl 1,2-cyclic phosphate phosphodiesterase